MTVQIAAAKSLSKSWWSRAFASKANAGAAPTKVTGMGEGAYWVQFRPGAYEFVVVKGHTGMLLSGTGVPVTKLEALARKITPSL